MTPSKPANAILGGAMVALILGPIGGSLNFASSETDGLGVYVLLALPFAIAIVTAWFVHAIDAMLITSILSASTLILVGWLCDCGELLVLMLPRLCVSMVAGAFAGVIVRAACRRWRTP